MKSHKAADIATAPMAAIGLRARCRAKFSCLRLGLCLGVIFFLAFGITMTPPQGTALAGIPSVGSVKSALDLASPILTPVKSNKGNGKGKGKGKGKGSAGKGGGPHHAKGSGPHRGKARKKSSGKATSHSKKTYTKKTYTKKTYTKKVYPTKKVVVRPVRRWYRKPYFGNFVAGVALGTIVGVAAVGVAPVASSPDLCWYWSDPYMNRGYWDYCY